MDIHYVLQVRYMHKMLQTSSWDSGTVYLIRFLLYVLSLEPSSCHNSDRYKELNEEQCSFIFCTYFNWKPLKFRKLNLKECGREGGVAI